MTGRSREEDVVYGQAMRGDAAGVMFVFLRARVRSGMVNSDTTVEECWFHPQHVLS